MCWLCIGRVRLSCVGWVDIGRNVWPKPRFWRPYVGRKDQWLYVGCKKRCVGCILVMCVGRVLVGSILVVT